MFLSFCILLACMKPFVAQGLRMASAGTLVRGVTFVSSGAKDAKTTCSNKDNGKMSVCMDKKLGWSP